MQIKRINILLYLILFSVTSALAQPYGNEWVDFTKNYFRISIPETGIYRITQDDLDKAGVPIGNFNPQNIQLIYKGLELPCYIKGESDGLIEYIEFYAEKNDGWFDVEMYDKPESQTNPYYSLINDTASVFFTWNTEFNNSRLQNETDTDFTGYSPAEYCIYTSFQQYTSNYATSYNDCEYLEAEGWFDNQSITLTTSRAKTLSTPGHVSNNVPVDVELALITYSSYNHHLNITGPGMAVDTSFYGKKALKLSSNGNINLEESSVFNFSTVNDGNATTDRSLVSYIKVTYPRNFNFNDQGNVTFTIPASANNKTYLEITGYETTGEVFVHDLTRGIRMVTEQDETTVRVLVPQSNIPIELFLFDAAYAKSASQIKPVTFVNHQSNDNDFIIISHPKLWEEAQNYATHRNAYLVNVEELYNQFGYGIQRHPMAIRNFLKYVYNTWSIAPKHFFIIGKGLTVENMRNSNYNTQFCLVPTFGSPPSDALFSTRVSNNPYTPLLPTGRLAARNNTQVADYLDKVKRFETQEPDEWMKQIIHFGGGANAYEQNLFQRYLELYEGVIEDTLFGGYVSTFLKTSSDPISISKSDSISNLVNEGVSLMTFFGHGSAANGFDQNIDEPETFNNVGKYPLILTNSCYSGNIHLLGGSKSEDWVIAEDKGSIGFLAMVFQGYPSYLHMFSNLFYRNLGIFNYGRTIGELINQTKASMYKNYPLTITLKSTIQEFTLHGDPAVVLNSPAKPDLSIQTSDISFNPATLTTQADSFYLNMVVTNIGQATPQGFNIRISRTFSDGSLFDTLINATPVLFKDTIVHKLPINRLKGIGNNTFTVNIDADNTIDELSEVNNSTTVNTFISSTKVTGIFPYNYSQISHVPTLLKAYTGNPLVEAQATMFQMDTSTSFTSPALITGEVTHGGGVVEWDPGSTIAENTVYFWRAAKKEDNEAPSWSQKSFIVNPGNTGWKQAHAGQITDNQLYWMEYSDAEKQFVYSSSPKTLRIINIGTPSGATEEQQVGYSLDGLGDKSSCGPAGAMVIAVFDSLSLVPWKSDRANYNHVNYTTCYNITRIQNYFVFRTGSVGGVDDLVNFMDTTIPDGNYYMIYSFNNGNFQNYTASQLSVFEEQGANQIRFVSNYYPYILFGHKGYPNETIEVVGESTDDIINLNLDLQGKLSYGGITSKKIGPSKQWQSFHWKWQQPTDNPDEIYFVRIYGIDNQENEVLLFDSVKTETVSLSSISTVQYPYLKLNFFTKDELLKTPAQIKEWNVVYTPAPDLAINPQKGWTFYADTLPEGEMGQVNIPFENISNNTMDSVQVNYWLQDVGNKTISIKSSIIKPLEAGELIVDTLSFKTLGLAGTNNFWAEINPIANRPDKVTEQFHFNNLVQKTFYVQRDASNPLLDVTFDGIHIMDGDIVSASPEIVIQLKDENPYIALDDTALISVYLKSKQTGIEQKVALGENPDIIFVPAELPENKARIIYSATFPEDGEYELRVQAKDPSGNESGSFDYLISFQVINESSITNVFNYPNPFSTSTRFVFELTGAQVPDEMRIEILTVTGKIVKVIYLEDLGPINIGRNITTYAWDGRDTYGDPLANGVYFYRVYARINGESLKIRDTGTSQYFKNGFGKMYLMR